MQNKITRIGLDLVGNRYTGSQPAIVVNRGGYWGNEAKRYRITPMRLRWVQAITSKGGFVRDDGEGRAMWYHNISSMYYGFKDEHELLILEVLPDLRLKISLTVEGKDYVNEQYSLWRDADNFSAIFTDLEYELLEDHLCNEWTLDPDDDGRYFISFDAGIDDEGDSDYSAGDLGWSYNFYAIRSYTETLYSKGYVFFDPYYFGELTLDDQRALSVTNYE